MNSEKFYYDNEEKMDDIDEFTVIYHFIDNNYTTIFGHPLSFKEPI